MTQEVLPDVPSDKGTQLLPPRVRSFAVGLGRLVVGILLALAANVVVLAVAIPLGFYLDRVYLTVAIAEGALLAACLVATVTLSLRRRRGVAVGLVVGWAAGYVGLVAVVIIAFAVLATLLVVLVLAFHFLGLLLSLR